METITIIRPELSGKIHNRITRTEGVIYKLLSYGNIVMIVISISQGQRIDLIKNKLDLPNRRRKG